MGYFTGCHGKIPRNPAISPGLALKTGFFQTLPHHVNRWYRKRSLPCGGRPTSGDVGRGWTPQIGKPDRPAAGRPWAWRRTSVPRRCGRIGRPGWTQRPTETARQSRYGSRISRRSPHAGGGSFPSVRPLIRLARLGGGPANYAFRIDRLPLDKGQIFPAFPGLFLRREEPLRCSREENRRPSLRSVDF